MRRSVIETILGAVVLLVAGFFLTFAYSNTSIKTVDGYQATARFNAIDGLTIGSDIRIGGVKVGSVSGQHVDAEMYQAVVELSIQDRIRLPEDSQISISSNGILGGKYVKITPGSSDVMVENGGEFSNTEDVLSMEDLIGRAIFLINEDTQ
ncbi:outer membrane lipid asymmetry maintenance protein MlaD [Aestuariispira insulae]|uniref:Phospholipid/cholesterol/gamma-HCH transport system substrate-binding protein n=1 Tax=Aestuariispira insulae TaxID=1461337 RepID=A0A3D9HKX6_9PROT|nr:outer membrane lipid asymmetry maintenance protein MlaD [Aestuariispira insulae]RED49951.1 phospholipid/cholesterol/gamma-HCH transport system substrate-binding protein [Aestuariispira insulae]